MRRFLVLALGFVCFAVTLSGCSFEDKVDMSEHYGTYVSASEPADFFVKNEDDYQKVANVEANIVIQLDAQDQQDMSASYFKLANKDVYIDATKVMPTQSEVAPHDYIPYLVFNENLNTKDEFTLYNEENQPVYHVNQNQTYPIFIKEQDRYGVKLDDTLFYISKTDIKDTVVAQNTSDEEATQVPVLMYHAFYDKNNPPKELNGNYVEKEDFRQHLQYMKDQNFTTLRMIDVDRYLDGNVRLPKRSVSITMDDGYDNEAMIAGPLLKEYGFYGTAFLITDWYEDGKLPDYWVQAKEMGLETQSHSQSMHAGGCDEQHGGRILCIDHNEGVQDIKTSLGLTGGFVFCYPFGDFNNHAKEILKDAGIRMAFTVQYGTIEPGMDKLALPRIRVHGEADINRFAASITY